MMNSTNYISTALLLDAIEPLMPSIPILYGLNAIQVSRILYDVSVVLRHVYPIISKQYTDQLLDPKVRNLYICGVLNNALIPKQIYKSVTFYITKLVLGVTATHLLIKKYAKKCSPIKEYFSSKTPLLNIISDTVKKSIKKQNINVNNSTWVHKLQVYTEEAQSEQQTPKENDDLADIKSCFMDHVNKANQGFNSDPSTEDKLQLYALYKQSTTGPCTIESPSKFDIKGYKKWQSWNKLGDMKKKDAMHKYIELVKQLSKNGTKIVSRL